MLFMPGTVLPNFVFRPSETILGFVFGAFFGLPELDAAAEAFVFGSTTEMLRHSFAVGSSMTCNITWVRIGWARATWKYIHIYNYIYTSWISAGRPLGGATRLQSSCYGQTITDCLTVILSINCWSCIHRINQFLVDSRAPKRQISTHLEWIVDPWLHIHIYI